MRGLQLSLARFALNQQQQHHHRLLLLLHHRRRRYSDVNAKPKKGTKAQAQTLLAKIILRLFFKESIFLNPNPSKCDLLLLLLLLLRLQLRAEGRACAAPDPGAGSAAQPRVSPASAAGNPAAGAVQGPRRQLGQRGARLHPNAIKTLGRRSRDLTGADLHLSAFDI